jgi:hypothetical protein
MLKHALILSRRLFALFTFLAGFALPAAAAAEARVSETYGKLPLHFEANRGQTHGGVRFLARGPGYGLYLTAGEAVLVLTRPNPDVEPNRHGTQVPPDAQAQVESVALRMSLVGAAPKPLVSGLHELPGKANYFIGKDPAKWRTNVPTYAKVHYRDVYPGIDLVYYGSQRQLEYDFVVASGADPKKIVLGFKGADKLEIDEQGDLVLYVAGGDIRVKRPVIYQEIDGVRQEIAGAYVLKGKYRVGFELAAYDANQPLVIDPVILSYSTYLGGTSFEEGRGIAVDVNGNAYVMGKTGNTLPTTLGASQPAFSGGSDAFVAKLNSTGSALVYSTYLGGSRTELGYAITVDADGSAYLTGATSSTDFPTTPGAFQLACDGGPVNANGDCQWDAFVTKLNATGSELVYSTYLGGSFLDGGQGIAVDSDGNAYVAGATQSSNFPTTPGSFQPSQSGCCGAFVTKLNPSGSALVYSTYLGGANGARGIALDTFGNAYVTGSAGASNFPITLGAFQPIHGGKTDAFALKLNSAGSALIYSTYLGGSEQDFGYGIAVDADHNAYVSGFTESSNFLVTPGVFQPINRGGGDAFVTKLNRDGSALVYSTFLGGSKEDHGFSIAVDTLGNAHVTGRTGPVLGPNCCNDTNDFPTTPGAFQPLYGGDRSDAFVTKLNDNGSFLLYSTYLGGVSTDEGFGIAVDASSNAYVTGITGDCFNPDCSTNNFPTTPGAFQPNYGGSGDAFVAKLPTSLSTTRSEESAATYTGTWTTYGPETGTFSGGTILASSEIGATATFSFTGTAVTWIGVRCEICGIATVTIDGGAPTVVDTAGPDGGSLSSEPVFSASGLAPDVSHTMVITVTSATTSLQTGPLGNHVAVDAFDVTR